jgi:importin subunit beta-1
VIKQSLLAALASPKSEPARTAAAQAIAKAGGIDVPAKEWPDILPMLLGAAMNPALEPGVKAATLKALGYLLEELPGEAVDQPTVNQVLTAIVDALGPGRARELVRAGTQALFSALDFAGENFEDSHAGERNALMTAICGATQSDDAETRSGGFDCIIRVAELFYGALGPYMNTLAQLTFGAAAKSSSDEASAVRAVEFWTTLAEAEADMEGDDAGCRRYTLTALGPLVEMLTVLMLSVREEDDEDAYGPSQAAASCLGAVARVAKDAVLEHVMPFVNGNFGAAKWEGREAATLAMGVVMDGPAEASVAALVNKALPPMLERLVRGGAAFDASPAVRDTTAWTIGHAFDLLFDSLDMNALFGRTIEVLKGALEDEPRVAQNAAYALHNIAQNCGRHEAEATRTTPLSPHLMALIGALMARCDRDDWSECNLRSVCYETINMMVENAAGADEPVLLALLQEAARRLQVSLAKPLASADDREEQGGLQVLLTSMIYTIVAELGDAVKGGADVLVELLLRVLQCKQSSAVEEAYRALGAVATGTGADFARFMPAVFPRLLEGVANIAEYQVCQATIWCAGEVIRALDGGIVPFIKPLADSLLHALASQELDRSVKPMAIGVIGDLALAAGPALEPHLGPISLLLDQAASMQPPRVRARARACVRAAPSRSPSGVSRRSPLPRPPRVCVPTPPFPAALRAQDADEDIVEYIGDLRKSVVEAWVGIFQGYNCDAGKVKGASCTTE